MHNSCINVNDTCRIQKPQVPEMAGIESMEY